MAFKRPWQGWSDRTFSVVLGEPFRQESQVAPRQPVGMQPGLAVATGQVRKLHPQQKPQVAVLQACSPGSGQRLHDKTHLEPVGTNPGFAVERLDRKSVV